MTATEKELREQLAACYRIFDMLGWSELIYNHITVKIPGGQEHFLINPYGLHYSEVTASNLVKVDLDANIIDDTPFQVNPAGMLIHSAIHQARPDVHCISHLHTTAGMTVACQKEGLRKDNFYSVLQFGKVAYHDFEGLTVLPDEKLRLVKNLGDSNQLILRSHGLLSCGKTIPHMFLNTWALQRSCEIQVACDNSGRALVDIPEAIAQKTEQLLSIQHSKGSFGDLEFNAMARRVDKIDNSYRDL